MGADLTEQGNARLRRGLGVALPAVILAVLVALYLPGLGGPFLFDDFPNIVDNAAVNRAASGEGSLGEALLSNESGRLKRPLAALSFALDARRVGGTGDPFGFKVTNLGIHALNTLLVYALSLLLLRRFLGEARGDSLRPLLGAALVAAAWAMHPLHLTSVLYVVQRMASLSALFTLAGLVLFVLGRQRVEDGRLRAGLGLMATGWLGGLALGLASKENAALLPLFMLLVELTCFGRGRDAARPRPVQAFHLLSVGVPAVLAVLYLFTHPGFLLEAYAVRPFSPVERLLTESRVLWFYLGLLAFPAPARVALFHDDLVISTSLLTPWTTLPALGGLVLLAVLAVGGRRRWPVFTLAVGWYLVAHLLESTVLGLEIAHEHRNYVADVGPLLALGWVLVRPTRAAVGPLPRAAAAIALLAMLSAFTHLRVQAWSSETSLIASEAAHHPGSARSRYMQGEYLLRRRGDPLAALDGFAAAARAAPWESGYLVKMVTTASQVFAGSEASTAVFLPPSVRDDFEPRPFPEGRGLAPTDALSRRLDTGLRTGLLTPFTVSTLGGLAACAVDGRGFCEAGAGEIAAWMRGAVGNRTALPEMRRDVALELANMHLERGENEQAVAVAAMARAAGLEHPVLYLIAANAQVLAGDTTAARATLDALTRRFPDLDADFAGHALVLRSAAERAGTATKGPAP